MLQLPRLRDHRQELSQDKPLGMNPLPNILTMNRSKGIYLTWSIIRFQYNIQPTAFLNMAKDHWSYLALFHLTRIFFHLFCCVRIHGIPHPSRSKVVYCSVGSDWGKIGLRTKAGRCRIWIILYLLKKPFDIYSQPVDTGKNESVTLKSRAEAILQPDGLAPLQSPPLPNTHHYIHQDIWGKEPSQSSAKHYKSKHLTTDWHSFSFLFPNIRLIPRGRKNGRAPEDKARKRQAKSVPQSAISVLKRFFSEVWGCTFSDITREESASCESSNSAVTQVIKPALLFFLQFLARSCSQDSIVS